MDKVWYRNPSKSEVIGRYGGVEKTPNDHDKPTKSQTLKNCLSGQIFKQLF